MRRRISPIDWRHGNDTEKFSRFHRQPTGHKVREVVPIKAPGGPINQFGSIHPCVYRWTGALMPAQLPGSEGHSQGDRHAYSFWQWADSGTFPGDQDVWNGTLARLRVLACNGPC